MTGREKGLENWILYKSSALSPSGHGEALEMTSTAPLTLSGCDRESPGSSNIIWFSVILEMLRIVVKLHFSQEKASKQRNYSSWPPKRVFSPIFYPQKLMHIWVEHFLIIFKLESEFFLQSSRNKVERLIRLLTFEDFKNNSCLLLVCSNTVLSLKCEGEGERRKM